MAKQYRINPGPLANGIGMNKLLHTLAIIFFMVAVALIWLWVVNDRPSMVITALIFIAAGIVLLVLSSKLLVSTIYLDKDNTCKILKGEYRCKGGCNKCVFAFKYLSDVGNGAQLPPSETYDQDEPDSINEVLQMMAESEERIATGRKIDVIFDVNNIEDRCVLFNIIGVGDTVRSSTDSSGIARSYFRLNEKGTINISWHLKGEKKDVVVRRNNSANGSDSDTVTESNDVWHTATLDIEPIVPDEIRLIFKCDYGTVELVGCQSPGVMIRRVR